MATKAKRSRPDDVERAVIREVQKAHAPRVLELAKMISEAASELVDIDEKMWTEFKDKMVDGVEDVAAKQSRRMHYYYDDVYVVKNALIFDGDELTCGNSRMHTFDDVKGAAERLIYDASKLCDDK